MALHQAQPPRPEEALAFLRQADALAADTPERLSPRWRTVALEARALALLADQYKQLDADGRSSKSGPDLRDALERLQTKVPVWLERARTEAQQPLPNVPVTLPPTVHTVASLAVRPSPTDLPGLFDFLALAVQRAGSPPEVLARLELTVAVCDKLTSAEQTPAPVLRDVSVSLPAIADSAYRRVNHLLRAEKQVQANILRSPAWAKLCERLDQLGERILERKGGRDAEGYLNLARTAQAMGRQPAALRLAQRGLEIVGLVRREASDKPKNREGEAPAEPEAQRLAHTEATLHTVAAWAYLVQNNVAEARTHLAPIRRAADKALAGPLHLLEGLLALQEGRLETAVRELEEARQTPAVANGLYPYLGLVHAYIGLGKYDRALTNLDKVRQALAKAALLSPEAQAAIDWLLPNESELKLDYFRCHLGLGNLEEALAFKEDLAGLPEGKAATVLLVQACRARAGKPDAETLCQAARRDIVIARMRAPDEAVYAAAEADLFLCHPETNVPVVASALATLATSPANLGVHVVENLRLRKGLAWHLEKAEEVLHAQAARTPEDLTAQLIWARWLAARGRDAEANVFLRRLEEGKDAVALRRIQLQRALLLLARGPSPEAAQLVDALGVGQRDLRADLLGVYYAVALEGNRAEAEQRLTRAFSRHGNSGLLHYWKGQLAEAGGDLPLAARSYALALPFSQVHGGAQRGLLNSLLALSKRQSPAVAQTLAAELLRVNPQEPALVLARAELSFLQEDMPAMEAALRSLDGLLREQGNPVLGPYFLARGWRAAGRPDLARREIDRALQAKPLNSLALLLAGDLAMAAAEWDRCLKLAAALEEAQPERTEPLLWRATALEHLGRAAEAVRICQQLVDVRPNSADGYLTAARASEKIADYENALAWVKAWRTRNPGHAEGLEAHVRILVRAGRTDEAIRVAERTLAERQRLEKGEAAARQELTLAIHVALGLVNGGAFGEAEAWVDRALAAAKRVPGAERGNEAVTAALVRGDLYLRRCQQEASPQGRQAWADRAIEQYRFVFERVPGHPIAGNNLAWLLSQERGDREGALAVVRQVLRGQAGGKPLEADRLSLDLLDTMGVVYRGAGHYKDALDLFLVALRRYPDEPRVYLHLGRSYAGLQQYRPALDSLARATRLATVQAGTMQDPERKAQLLAVAEAARQEQAGLRGQ
jgi:predicted Zn-dependent protease